MQNRSVWPLLYYLAFASSWTQIPEEPTLCDILYDQLRRDLARHTADDAWGHRMYGEIDAGSGRYLRKIDCASCCLELALQ